MPLLCGGALNGLGAKCFGDRGLVLCNDNLGFVCVLYHPTRYEGPLLDESVFQAALELGPSSPDFTRLVEWVSTELAGLAGLEDHVNAISDANDSETFLMELSGFLREYGKKSIHMSHAVG